MPILRNATDTFAEYLATATSLSPAASSAVASQLATRYEQDGVSDPVDPYLEVLPAFTYSMPVQVVILGVTVTLLGILLVHLLFTVRYHLPLSKINYSFQVSAVVLALGNVAAQLHIVMTNLAKQGRRWPFAYDYIEVSMPPRSWSQAERGAWLFLQGANSLCTHSTHIQFLTMLFPSRLEMKLILGLLGPLALATAGLYFTSLAQHPAVIDLGDAIRTTANSSLTLLYTFALFIWGLTLNRKRAWRTDGGTAAFGVLAMILGVMGTAVNFVEIREDRMRWLPGVVTCILLWQSWVGFWWWVGAGMWTGEAEDVERREARKLRRAEARKARREAREREQRAQSGVASGASVSGTSVRRRTIARPVEEIELQDMARATGDEVAAAAVAPAGEGTNESVSSGSTSQPASHHFYTPVLSYFSPFLARLRNAHDEAAVARAARPPGLPEDVRRGWGIKALMLKGKRERGERREGRVGSVVPGGERDATERRAGFEADGGTRLGGEDWEDDVDTTESGASASRRNAYPPVARRADAEARETGEEPAQAWAGRGMDGVWRGWRSAIARWRLADVSQY
ncbi:hypothetical protein OIV83_000407 [Microbotryomycetes sp. JL201]|nr:hypothetical protein OIV83_000407 [Microbotryomycetes sp. JL201]